MSNSRIKIVCWRLLYWLKSQYRTVFLKYFPFLQNTAGKNPPKIAKYDFSRELKEKLREEARGESEFFLSKYWILRREREIFFKISNLVNVCFENLNPSYFGNRLKDDIFIHGTNKYWDEFTSALLKSIHMSNSKT